MTVIDRDRPDRLLTNITVEGGLFTPRHPLDNGLCIAVGHHVLFKGCRVDCAGGQRGFAIQTDRYVTKKITTPIRFVRLVGCESFGGGENGLDIESAGDDNLIADVLVESMNISGGKDATIRCSANGNGHHLYHVLLSNIIITDTAHCMWYADVCRGLVDGVIMDISGSDGNCAGIDIRGAVDCAISNIIITGSGSGYRNRTYRRIPSACVEFRYLWYRYSLHMWHPEWIERRLYWARLDRRMRHRCTER